MRRGLTGDWERKEDTIKGKTWKFEGERKNFKEGLEQF
jgi:hypothetical protein